MIPGATLNLPNPSTGQTGLLTALPKEISAQTPAELQAGEAWVIEIINNSTALLYVSWITASMRTYPIPSGWYRRIPVPPGEVGLNYTVGGIGGGTAVVTSSQVLTTFYAPYENLDELGGAGATPGGSARVIALPPTPIMRDIAPYVPVAGTDQIIATDPVNGGRPIPTNPQIQSYFWSILLEARLPAVTTIVGMDFYLHVDSVTGGGAVVDTVRVAEGTVYSGQGAAASGQAFFKPYALQAGTAAGRINLPNIPQTAVNVRWVLHCINLVGSPNIGGSIFAYTDQANELFPGIYGDGAESALGNF